MEVKRAKDDVSAKEQALSFDRKTVEHGSGIQDNINHRTLTLTPTPTLTLTLTLTLIISLQENIKHRTPHMLPHSSWQQAASKLLAELQRCTSDAGRAILKTTSVLRDTVMNVENFRLKMCERLR